MSGHRRRRRRRERRGLFTRFLRDVLGFDRLGPVGTALLFAAPVVAAALFYVWTHVHAVRLGYALSDAGERHQTLVEEQRALELDVAALKAPERLESVAKKYGLAPPKPEQVIRMPAEEPAP